MEVETGLSAASTLDLVAVLVAYPTTRFVIGSVRKAQMKRRTSPDGLLPANTKMFDSGLPYGRGRGTHGLTPACAPSAGLPTFLSWSAEE